MHMTNTQANIQADHEAEYRIAELEYLPAPSPIVARLLASITERHTTFEDIASIIESDAAVTSQLLRIANSAYYGFRNEVNNLNKAVMLIGIREVRNLCLAICLVSQFNPQLMPKGFELYTFWTHNLMTSFCCREIARKNQWLQQDESYLMGLLHDLGRLAGAAAMPDRFNSAVLISRKKNIPISAAEEASGMAHTELGKWLAIKWGFPGKLKAVMRYHHDPLSSVRYSRECAVVLIAAYIARVLESGQKTDDLQLPSPKIAALAGIDTEDIDSLLGSAEKIQQEVSQLASVLTGGL